MDRKGYKILSIAILAVAFLSSCKKTDTKEPPPPVTGGNKIFVVCEGSYGNGNSSLGRYDVEDGNFYEDIFHSANGQQLGDVFQSMQSVGNYYLLCVNNSDKILVVTKTDYKLVKTITVSKPRYILPVSSQKAYVSTLFSNKIYVLDIPTLEVTGSITLPGENPEGMLQWGDQAIVCTWDTTSNKIYYINTATDIIDKEIAVAGNAPHSCVMDKEAKLWVLSGNAYKGKSSALTRLDPSSGTILKSYLFTPGTEVIKPVMNAAKDSLYFIEVDYNGGLQNNGVYRMSIATNNIPQQPFLAAKRFQYFWALGIDHRTGNIVIGDPKGFVQKGSVSVYQPNGDLLHEFKTGVGPGHFYFD